MERERGAGQAVVAAPVVGTGLAAEDRAGARGRGAA